MNLLEPEVLVPAPPPNTLRFMVWNALNGGIDNGSKARLIDQLPLIAACTPDVLCVPEATHWHRNWKRLLRLVTKTLDLKAVTLARSKEGKSNSTALLYNPKSLRLVTWTLRGQGVFHHTLIRATLRPKAAGEDPSRDFLVYATHWNPLNPAARLGEGRWMTDSGDSFPGLPPRAVVIGDFNTPDREPESWGAVPKNLHSRYRFVREDGSFGGTDQRAVQVLLRSGWQDPHTVLGVPRPPTVGHYYDNERVPWALDYALLAGLAPAQVWTHPFDEGFRLSDHLPHFVDVLMTG